MWIAIAAMAAAISGQVAKFDSRAPEANYLSKAGMEDVERCLLRYGSPPAVYRQPDRPNDVMLVWTGVSLSAGNATGRVDLHRAAAGTEVRAWLPSSVAERCAPR